MKILKFNELPKECQEKYEEIVKEYNINTIYYIEDKLDLLYLNEIDIDGYKLNISKGLSMILPIKEYFTIILESRSRENIKEPYWNYRLYKLDKLLEIQQNEEE